MNRAILTLLLDYLRRTLGVWVLLVFVQMMHMSTIWVMRSEHAPIIGAVITSLVFCATWDSPHVVMRTLPVKASELALLRWWERIGAPMPFIGLALVMAWFANIGSAFPVPPFAELLSPLATSFATLGILSVLPLPMLSTSRSNTTVFVIGWIVLTIGGLYGLPMEWLPDPLPQMLFAVGSLLALVSLRLARSGRVLVLPPLRRLGASARLQDRSRGASRLHGWPVLVMQWARTTLLLALASIVIISLVRPHVRLLQQALPWLFVSATGAVGTILARRWLRGVRALQCLPIRSSTLALIVCVALIAPVLVASAAATAVHAIVPAWGIAIPLYMVPVFAIVPALEISWHKAEVSHAVASSVQQWSPIMQVIAWPLWTGSFMSLELTRLLPAWFDVIAIGSAVVLAVIAYVVVLTRLRSGVGLERLGDPLTPR